MDKLEYIIRQFSRAENKRYEHYVVTRVWHLLDDLSIKFVTQQYVSRPEGRALTDMYFPQFKIHIEIDEGHHKKRIEWDKLREVDIINATNHEIFRIDVTKDIELINQNISVLVNKIKNRKLTILDFKAWDIEAEQNPRTYIERGYMDVKDDIAFKQSYLAANCFGYNYKGFQRGGTKHPIEKNKIIWFPKLYKNGAWNNSISNDELEIREICETPALAKKHIDRIIHKGAHNRIIFARVKSPLGDIMYRFKGEYKLDVIASNYEKGLLWKRISERVKTYSN